MTHSRLKAIWRRKPLARWMDAEDPMHWRTDGDTRSKHGRMARARRAWLKAQDATHRRVRESLERRPRNEPY